jgi:hypothetical protein
VDGAGRCLQLVEDVVGEVRRDDQPQMQHTAIMDATPRSL